ncbi:MAG TPA: hypothetical protein VKD90_09125 [Gemmataceae bacterium]|nr:hypothetical protein [Gemmataceae bacterium]
MRLATLGRLLIATALFAAVVGLAPSLSCAADAPVPLGMNLAGVADWSSEIVFVDAFKASRPWISQKEGAEFGQGGDLAQDARGWITRLNDRQFGEALIYMDIGNHYPGGKYICLFDGNGELEFSNAAQGKPAGKGRYAVDVDPARGFIALRVRKTDPKSPIKNIRLVKAEHEKTQQTQPFSPDLLKRYKGFQVIRFMDWQRTNNSKIEKWDQRALPTDATQASEKGVALEYCVQLANTLDADPWLCIPHKADDDYVRQFAALVKKQLNPKRKVYVEYSNETWNTIFDQAKYCKEKGLALGLSTNEYEGQLRYSAQRSVEIFKIFEKEFGGKDRLVRVLCAHSANPWTGTTTMDWKQASKSADAIAIAPYFGNAYGDAKTADKVAEMSVDELLDGCKKMIADNRKKNETYAAEAKKRGLKLMAYESGQHLAGVGGAENNEKLTNLFHAANRHPRMKELYLEDLKNWKEVGGSTFCVFSSVGKYSKWGSWGMMEWSDQKEDTAPKMMALREFLKQTKK